MTYRTIVVYDDDERFDKAVSDAIAEGWQLQGGVSVAAYHIPGDKYSDSTTTIIYAQAMTKATDATA